MTLQEIQDRLSAALDQDPSVTAGAGDWDLRLKYINMAQTEWSQFYDWQVLYKEYATSTGSLSSISLPSDFRKLATYPRITTGNTVYQYDEVRPQERFEKGSEDTYAYIMGNTKDGYTMVLNPEPVSITSISVPYYAIAAALASPSDVTIVPDANYLVHRALAYITMGADDTRFTISAAEADKLMARMLEREATHSEGAYDGGRVRTVEEKRYSFRIGRD
jgi:hypothetical protein